MEKSVNSIFADLRDALCRSGRSPWRWIGEHVRATLASIKPYKNVIDYELLSYHRFGEGKYGFLGRVYGLSDFQSLEPETLKRLQAIIDEAFGRRAERR